MDRDKVGTSEEWSECAERAARLFMLLRPAIKAGDCIRLIAIALEEMDRGQPVDDAFQFAAHLNASLRYGFIELKNGSYEVTGAGHEGQKPQHLCPPKIEAEQC